MIEDDSLIEQIGADGFAERKPNRMMVAAEVYVGWNDDDSGRIINVLITDDLDEWTRLNRQYDNTGGRCLADWMKPVNSRMAPRVVHDTGYDPLGLFGEMLSRGFSSKRAYRNTLHAFAQIESCPWARRFLYAVDQEWVPADLSQPY